MECACWLTGERDAASAFVSPCYACEQNHFKRHTLSSASLPVWDCVRERELCGPSAPVGRPAAVHYSPRTQVRRLMNRCDMSLHQRRGIFSIFDIVERHELKMSGIKLSVMSVFSLVLYCIQH